MNNAIKIEKNIPLPANHQRKVSKKFPFDEMEVGDSFFAPGVKRISMSARFSQYHKHTTKRFTARSVDGGVRYWRLA